MENLKSDVEKEREKYDSVASTEVVSPSRIDSKLNLLEISDWYREPFVKYYENIEKIVQPAMVVLELGAGCGNHTAVICETNAKVIALDISEKSLGVCKTLFSEVETVVGNIEKIPLQTNSVDIVVSAGSLSYGNHEKVRKEIFRVLKPGGSLIVLDSLNHNFAYRINRYIHYKRGKRTLSTLQRMPDQKYLEELMKPFKEAKISYFGSYLWLTILLSKFIGNSLARKLDKKLEKWFPSKLGAFKFLLSCKGLDTSKY
jgi:ubiquinone/menaquinone biosynthesis C-methylase UbiE